MKRREFLEHLTRHGCRFVRGRKRAASPLISINLQLAAQKLRPESFVCMAAYGDYGPGYIGTAAAYAQGGYETSIVSRVSPRSEAVLMDALQQLVE